jgi:serine protease AprX
MRHGKHVLGVAAALCLASCSYDASDPDLIEIPGSNVKILRTGPDEYSISLDGARFHEPRVIRYGLALSRRAFDPKTDGEPPSMIAADAVDTELYIVQFVVHPLEAIQNHVTTLGARVYRYLPTNSLLVRMTPAVAAEVQQQRYVRWVGQYRASYRVSPGVMARPSAKVYARALDASMKHALAQRIAALGGTVHDAGGSSPLVIATLSRDAILELALDNQIEYIDEWSPPEADMDIAREISGSNFIESIADYTGAGIRAEVMDGNVLETHGDFASRPLVIHGMNRSGAMSHGTATAGILFGDGTGDPKGRGILPSAQGIFASYQDLQDRYAHTGELLGEPYFAVFQSNSWGGTRTTEYTNVSAEMDRILFDHDILIFQSQSNAGSRMSRPEAWAKNIVSVGAFNHKDTLDPGDDRWENTASIGPAADGRIKPDLAHFYDATHAPTSSNPSAYGAFGGTSGATPITAGHAGIFLEMWADGLFGDPGQGATVFEKRPHMTTAKAMLINTAWRYQFATETADLNRHHQGWGRVDLKNMYELREKIYVVDETDVLSPLASTKHELMVAANEPELRVTMVYADPPGTPAATHARVNDLTLRVISPSGVEYFGNHGLRQSNYSMPGGAPDTIDTVENVFIAMPEAGTWTIEVRADEIVADAHVETMELDADYALVVTGVVGRSTPPPPPPGRVRISQVAYDTPGIDADEEWIELFNPTGSAIDVGGFRLADNGGTYTLPPNTIVPAGQHFSIARTAAGFMALFDRAPGLGGMTLSLGNTADELRLLDPNGAEVDRVMWENPTAGWPIAANTGSSIRRIDATVDTDTVADWEVATPAAPR